MKGRAKQATGTAWLAGAAATAGKYAITYGPLVALLAYGFLRTQPRPQLRDLLHL
jgi:hypothetical protein